MHLLQCRHRRGQYHGFTSSCLIDTGDRVVTNNKLIRPWSVCAYSRTLKRPRLPMPDVVGARESVGEVVLAYNPQASSEFKGG